MKQRIYAMNIHTIGFFKRYTILFGWWNLAITLPLILLLYIPLHVQFFVSSKLNSLQGIILFFLFSLMPPGLLALIGEKGIKPIIGSMVYIFLLGSLCDAIPLPSYETHAFWYFCIIIITSIPLSIGLVRMLSKNEHFYKASRILSISVLISLIALIADSDIPKALWSPNHETPQSQLNHITQENLPSIFVLIFDEFPLYFLYNKAGKIDGEIFPNFKQLADTSHWYKNATSTSASTRVAIPAMMTGMNTSNSITYKDNIPNLFTLLGGEYIAQVREATTQLCPPNICTRSSSINKSASDLIFLSIAAILKEYHTIFFNTGNQWDGFSRDKDFATVLDSHLGKIPTDTAKPILFFFHAVEIPHNPNNFLPDGSFYRKIPNRFFNSNNNIEKYRVKLKQKIFESQYADKILGQMIDRIKEIGLYEKSVILVLSDHGTYFNKNGSQERLTTPKGIHSTLPILFFLKDSQQNTGTEHQQPIATTSILPMIHKRLGSPTQWPNNIKSKDSDHYTMNRKKMYNAKENKWIEFESTEINPLTPNKIKFDYLNHEILKGYTESDLVDRKINVKKVGMYPKIPLNQFKDLTESKNKMIMFGEINQNYVQEGTAIVATHQNQIVGVADITTHSNVHRFVLMINPVTFPMIIEQEIRIFLISAQPTIEIQGELIGH